MLNLAVSCFLLPSSCFLLPSSFFLLTSSFFLLLLLPSSCFFFCSCSFSSRSSFVLLRLQPSPSFLSPVLSPLTLCGSRSSRLLDSPAGDEHGRYLLLQRHSHRHRGTALPAFAENPCLPAQPPPPDCVLLHARPGQLCVGDPPFRNFPPLRSFCYPPALPVLLPRADCGFRHQLGEQLLPLRPHR